MTSCRVYRPSNPKRQNYPTLVPLTELLSAREPIVASLSRLESLVPHLDELHLQASLLSEKVSSTAQTADRVGGKVRSLGEEMRRVRKFAERVGQVMELKVIYLYVGLDENVIHHATLHSYHWHLFSLLLIARIGNLRRDIVLVATRSYFGFVC